MAKEKPVYEVNDEFNKMAGQIVEKFPEKFYGTQVDRICCVNIVNKERTESNKKLWRLEGVKMPVALHCKYKWYVVLHLVDWETFSEKQKLLLVAEILHGIPSSEDEEGVVTPDIKGYASMFRTFSGIDYLEDPDAPHLLNDDVEWRS